MGASEPPPAAKSSMILNVVQHGIFDLVDLGHRHQQRRPIRAEEGPVILVYHWLILEAVMPVHPDRLVHNRAQRRRHHKHALLMTALDQQRECRLERGDLVAEEMGVRRLFVASSWVELYGGMLLAFDGNRFLNGVVSFDFSSRHNPLRVQRHGAGMEMLASNILKEALDVAGCSGMVTRPLPPSAWIQPERRQSACRYENSDYFLYRRRRVVINIRPIEPSIKLIELGSGTFVSTSGAR